MIIFSRFFWIIRYKVKVKKVDNEIHWEIPSKLNIDNGEEFYIIQNYDGIIEFIPIRKDIHGGMFKLEKPVSTKLRYAMLITSRYIDTLERETDFTFFDSYSDDKLQNNITWLSQIVNIFKQSYSKVDYKVNAYIQIDDECYLNRINKNSVSCVYLKSFAKNYS